VKSFIERLIGPVGPSPVDQALEQAKAALDAGNFQAAGNLYSQILKHVPGDPQAIAGLARCFLALGKAKEAGDLLATVDPQHAENAAIKGARAALALADQSKGGGNRLAELEAKVASEADHQAASIWPAYTPPGAMTTRSAPDRDHPARPPNGTRDATYSFSSCSGVRPDQRDSDGPRRLSHAVLLNGRRDGDFSIFRCVEDLPTVIPIFRCQPCCLLRGKLAQHLRARYLEMTGRARG
jgi:tetratricopeptide (TPR) repeat protein